MTTITVVRKHQQIAIAADTLTTFGSTRLAPAYDRSPEKIIAYQGSYLGIAGSAAHQIVLENLLARHPGLDLSSKSAIYESFRTLHPLLKDEAFLNPKEDEEDPYESSQLTAMIANAQGIFAVYSLREVFEFDTFWAVGSGRDFALGAMYARYGEPDLTAAELATLGVQAGAEFDTGSSLPITLRAVTSDRQRETR
jgi:ATP-dependent HslUV protease, peptidase subunit HslV